MSGHFDGYADRAARLHRQAQADRREARKDADRARLAALLRKKIMTAGVGALAAFEAAFGSLWGDGKPPGERTEDERAWLALFLRVRDDVFDKINRQARGAEAELGLHSVEFTGVRVCFGPPPEGPPPDGDP